MTQTPAVRPARPDDLDALDRLEQRCFSIDAQSRRSLRWLLCRANAKILVMGPTDALHASLVQLYRRRSRVARVYSIAVAPEQRGAGLADKLIEAAVADAEARECRLLRAEIRVGNRASRRLFERHAFTHLEDLPGYYPDGEDGVRVQRILTGREVRTHG